jgi:hypothetical protein
MASKTIRVYTSDLTGRDIAGTDELVEVRVLDHPSIDRPVKLDAYALEVQSLLESNDQFVTLELVLPGEKPRRLVVAGDRFTKVFTADVDDVLANAEAYTEGYNAPRRGRPAGGMSKAPAKPKADKDQLQAIREWARQNGHGVSDRGRISQTVRDAFDAAHSG